MATKKTIAIIGALKEKGREVVQYLTEGDYRLLLFYKRKEEGSVPAHQQTGDLLEIEWISCPVEACWEADIVILALPREEQWQVASAIKSVLTGKPVIDLSNEANAIKELEKNFPHSTVFSILPNDIHKLIQTII